MARNQVRLSQSSLFACLMLIGLICLFTPENVTGKFHFAFIRLMPVSVLNSGLRMLSSAAKKDSPSEHVPRRLYEQMENYAANLRAQRDDLHQRLQKIAKMRSSIGLDNAAIVTADVISSNITGTSHELIINQGGDNGLKNGQFVLGDNSIIGVVSDVSSRTAKVRLISDPGCKVPVKICASDAYIRWKMEGDGKVSARIRMLPKTYDIAVGDIVYIDKKPGFLDTPIIAGKVIKCKPDDDNPLLWDITVKPASNLDSLAAVTVVVMNPQN